MSKDPWAPLTTYQAAQELGVSVRRVQALIRAGKLKATKIGRDWLIIYDDLEAVRNRQPGRPPSAEALRRLAAQEGPR